ncbi:hypothetical protein DSO57_1008994 [Entomophthora muscae]|uniref:Uncharacterized protein n=1 Tax=Entomophthora muscae TaxID=34485 RepID=A0ACC2THX1_9FUNG|nr:hypothetical protein DSO57_1008994 [Entomophthora muscae]
MTLDALGEAVMGFTFNATRNPKGEYALEYHRAAAAVSNNLYFLFPFLESWPLPWRIQDRKAVRHFRDLTRRILKTKQQCLGSGKEDLLSMMLNANADDQLLDDDELINNTILMFAAGHDTTANTLCFTLYHLARNSKVQEEARSHIISSLGITTFPEQPTIPTKTQAAKMTYLDAVSLECMRLSPSLPQMRRHLKKSHSLPDGTILPTNTLVLLQIFTAMNDPKYWHNPQEFNPARFLDGPALSREAQRNFFGFGNGTRSCIGFQMSLMEQKITLAIILQKFSLSLPPDSIHHHRLITTKDQLCRPVNLKILFTPI